MDKTFGINAMSKCLFNHYKCKRNLTKSECQEIPKFLCDCMLRAIVAKKKIRIERVGVISAKTIRPKKSRNPKTGDVFVSSEKNGLRFKPSRYAIQKINNPSAKISRKKIVIQKPKD